MLIVQNGFELHTAQPTSHEYHFQAVPSPVTRNITAPFSLNGTPTMVSDMGESIRVTDYFTPGITADDCTQASFSFRLLSDPQTVHSLSSAQDPRYGNTYFPTIDGVTQIRSVQSWVPIKYCVFTTTQDGHVNADGTIFYTTDSPFVAILAEYADHEQRFVQKDNNLLNGFNGILLVPQSVSQQEYLYTVSGS